MKTFYTILIVLFFSNLTFSQSYFQKDSTSKQPVFEIVLKDGSKINGKILKQENGVVQIMTKNLGTVELKQENITSMNQLDEGTIPTTNDKGWTENPSPVSYFVSPSAQTLSKGQIELRNIWVVYNEVMFGVSDNFNVGVGIVPTVGLPVIFSAKLSIPLADNVKLGASSTNVFILGVNSSSIRTGGIANLFMTIGDRDGSLTLGTAFGHTNFNFSSTVGYNIAGNIRLGNRVSLVGEYSFTPSAANQNEGGVLIIGPKFIWRKITLDFGIPIVVSNGFVSSIPILGATFRLGKK
jgi:hypothetical protein